MPTKWQPRAGALDRRGLPKNHAETFRAPLRPATRDPVLLQWLLHAALDELKRLRDPRRECRAGTNRNLDYDGLL